jgi:hypothetical protein
VFPEQRLDVVDHAHRLTSGGIPVLFPSNFLSIHGYDSGDTSAWNATVP